MNLKFEFEICCFVVVLLLSYSLSFSICCFVVVLLLSYSLLYSICCFVVVLLLSYSLSYLKWWFVLLLLSYSLSYSICRFVIYIVVVENVFNNKFGYSTYELIHCIYLQDFAKSADLKLWGILKAFQTFEVLHCKKKNFIFISATI